MTEHLKTIDFGTVSMQVFAKSIGKPVSTVYSWRKNGNIPSNCFAQIGKCLFVKVDTMKNFLNGNMA